MRVWMLATVAALGACAWLAGSWQVASPLAAEHATADVQSGAAALPQALDGPLHLPSEAPATTVSTVAPALPTSLQGTEGDGGWRADAQGRLVVARQVRRRFDYWLSALGERPLDELGAQLLVQARHDLPPLAFAELRALLGRYVSLQQHAWQHAARPADPSSWRAALEERQSVRRQLLGREWADAFYGEEEQALWAEVLVWESGRGAPAQAQGPALPEHPQAVQRLAEVQAQWSQWERRLDEARGEVARLMTSPELSQPQREQAVQAWLAQRFSGQEQLRVRALLGLAPAPGA